MHSHLHGVFQEYNSIEAFTLKEQPMQLDTFPGGTTVYFASIGATDQW